MTPRTEAEIMRDLGIDPGVDMRLLTLIASAPFKPKAWRVSISGGSLSS